MALSAPLRSIGLSSSCGHLFFIQSCRSMSSKYDGGNSSEDLDAARKWFATFNESTIPSKIATTEFSKSSGPGGQKTNKTSSKATTVWPISSVQSHLPKVLYSKLRSSRYYVSSSDSFSIQCDSYRDRAENKDETHRRLIVEIRQIYKNTVPGETAPEQTRKVEQLKKAENTARLRMKKQHSDKKKSRKSGDRRDL